MGMTIILAIESSTDLASVALLTPDKVYSRDISGVQTHSHGILPAVQDLLIEADLPLSACQALAFDCGPGAFTGVRTACGVVQGLAFGLDFRVLPVVSLMALAECAREDQNWRDLVCILDARMGEVYWAHYCYEGSGWHAAITPRLATASDALVYAEEHGCKVVAGNGVMLPPTVCAENFLLRMPHAAHIARLGLQAFRLGHSLAAEEAQPLYLRDKVALTTAERMAVRLNANSQDTNGRA
jgi:tRNA threonylcarbamoyladenosine biosynthesis protein TsaB